VSDHDIRRPTAAKLYLETLAHATPSDNSNCNVGESASSADFERVKTMLEAAISKKRSVFISYLVEKKPTVEGEGGKKKCKKKREQPVLEETYRKIMPRCFEEGACGRGLKVIADCDLRDGKKREFFFHKITRIEDHNWKGTWKSQTPSKCPLFTITIHIYLYLYFRCSYYLLSFTAISFDDRKISHTTETRRILIQVQRQRF
jgi:hypothetical protein